MAATGITGRGPDPGLTKVNDPSSFYVGGTTPPSLFWELTVCQSLAEEGSPYQRALTRPRRYGEIVAEFLHREVGLEAGWSVVEIGGGPGSLMAALLERVPLRDLTMVDISPHFIERQREALAGRGPYRYVTADAVEYLGREDRNIDLVISNENLGDLPAVVGIRKEALWAALGGEHCDGLLSEVAAAVRTYGLDLREAPEVFHFNLGAIRYLECLSRRVRCVFLSEHGCDTRLPLQYSFLPLPDGNGYPREIPLKGHSEYSIRFDHLEQVAKVLGYRVRRRHMAEVLGLRTDAGLQAMSRVRTTLSEEAEMVHEFCEHVAEYQVMVLQKEAPDVS